MLDEPYATVARNLAQLVKSKPVCDVFVSKVVKLGTDKNNVWIETPTRHVHTWNHLFYKLPNHLLCAVSDSEEAVRGALRTNKTVLKRALDELSMDAFDIVLDLISQGSLYRGDQYKSDLEAFVALKKKYEVGNKHYFFILDGCKNPSPVRGFFNEYLRSELSQDRKTFEMLANKMKAPYSDNQLSGLGFSSTIRNSVICKVTGSFTRTIKVNF